MSVATNGPRRCGSNSEEWQVAEQSSRQPLVLGCSKTPAVIGRSNSGSELSKTAAVNEQGPSRQIGRANAIRAYLKVREYAIEMRREPLSNIKSPQERGRKRGRPPPRKSPWTTCETARVRVVNRQAHKRHRRSRRARRRATPQVACAGCRDGRSMHAARRILLAKLNRKQPPGSVIVTGHPMRAEGLWRYIATCPPLGGVE